jgi:mitofilin
MLKSQGIVVYAGRAELEEQGRRAQALWLACQTLSGLIKHGSLNPDEYELTFAESKPLCHAIHAIEEAGAGHPFVSTVLSAIPQDARKHGVYTEESLLQRFKKVRRVCRRVALIDDTKRTLPRFLLSYMQSFFVFAQGKPLSATDEIDPEDMSVFTILDNASYYLEEGNLEQALQFMNLLHGEARRVAADWIRDTRLLLETRLAGEALLAFSAARGLSSVY